MKARLLISSAAARGEEFVFGQEATLGRSRGSSIRVEGEGVSSRHARIYFDADRGRYFLEDLDSLNGTTLDGLAVTRPEPLDQLHVIDIAGVREFIFQELSRDSEDADAGAASGEPAAGPGTTTSVDEEMPPLPANLGTDQPAEPVDGTEPPTAKTSVDREMPELPANLAGDAADADGPPTAPMTKTSVDEKMPALPASLADGSDEVPPGPASAGEAPPAEPAAPEEASDGTAAEGSASEESSGDATPEESAEEPAAVSFALRFEGGEAADLVPLPEGERVLGRSRSADITVEGRSASRRHALLSVAQGRVTLRDLDSRNHTFVEGEKLTAEVELEVGARLRFGDVEAVLVEGEESEG